MSKTTNQAYKDVNYDRLAILVRKGKRDEYKAAAAGYGLGYAEMIRLAIEEYISNHGGEVVAEKPEPEKLSPEQRRLIDASSKLPESTRKIISKLVEDLAAQATNHDVDA